MPSTESDWTEFATLPIRSAKVCACDPYLSGDGPSVHDLPEGVYQVSVRKIADAVSRLRILQGDTSEIGECLAWFGVDFGQGCIFDPLSLQEEPMTEERYESLEHDLNRLEDYGTLQLNSNPQSIMAVAVSGYGDGSYPVFELLRDGRRVGLETVFVGPEVDGE